MRCEEFRDRFSALLEKELSPLEERVVREHLASCSECLKDFERFDRTIRWLHSVEEVEVPDTFLSGIYEKMEDRKRKGLLAHQAKRGWFSYPASLKIPIQAVAMVAAVFLVLYFTKMIPVEGPRLKDVDRAKQEYSEIEKMEERSIPREAKKERAAASPLLEKPGLKDIGPTRALVAREGKVGKGLAQKPAGEENGLALPPAKTETAGAETPRLMEAGKTEAPASESVKLEDGVATKEKASLAAKPPPEVILRISDQAKVISELQELVKRFAGEVVTVQENILLVSLPALSFSEFEKELVRLDSSAKAGKMMLKKDAPEGSSAPAGVKRGEGEEKAEEPARPISAKEGYITVRILLLPPSTRE